MRRLLSALTLLLFLAAAWFFMRAPAGNPGAELAPPDARPAAERELVAADALDPVGERSTRAEPRTPTTVPPAPDRSEVDPADDPPEEMYEEIYEGWFDNEELLALIGLPKDAPVALLIDRFGPPDPLERGDASVHLSLFDGDTGKPTASPVILWRLRAPANEYWTQGDKAVARADVPKGGHRFTDLPAGEYRAVCTAEHRDAPDLPPFFVSGRGETTLFLTLPGERPVRAEVRAHGERLAQVRVQFGPVSSFRTDHAPPWAIQREMIDLPVLYDVEFSSEEDSIEGDWALMLAGPDGFDLGMFPENRRDRVYHQSVYFRLEDGTTETLRVLNQAPGDVLRFELAIPDD